MSTLSQVGNQILQPKLKYHFRVRFYDHGTTNELEYGKTLSLQVTYVNSIVQDKNSSCHYVVMNFDDDVLNNTCDALQKLYALDAFDIVIEYLDRNDETVIRSHILSNCSVSTIYHAELDYGLNNIETRLQFIPPSYFTDHPAPAFEGLLEVLKASQFLINDGQSYRRPALSKRVNIDFEKLTIK